jgi:hypothetical protein
MMQHHGAPTRLLDFTKSPYVAAFFAFEDPGPQDRAVWALNYAAAAYHAGRVVSREDATNMGTTPFEIGSAASEQLRVGPTQWRGLAAFPVLLSTGPERMAIQQGAFVWPNEIRQSTQANIEAIGRENIEKIVLPRQMREQAIEDLRYMNITRASLFPGLDGFAASLRNAFVHEDVHARRMRSAVISDRGLLRVRRAKRQP